MDATHLDTFVTALIDDLAPAGEGTDRSLFDLLDCPRPVVDEPALLAVLVAAVTARNLFDHVIASAVAATERLGIPARRHLRSGADLLTSIGVAPGVALRAVRVGRAAPMLPALTCQQRLGGLGIEFADAVGRGVAHIAARVELTEEDRATVVTKLMIQTTPAQVSEKAREIAIEKAATQPQEEGAVPVAENTDLNDMTLVQTDEGRVAATLDLDVLTGEELFAALDPLCRPVPLPDGSPDPRPAGRRRADAFGQLVRGYLSSQRRPTSGGVLPHVTLIRPATIRPGARGQECVDTLGFGGPISAVTADLISCDSTLTAVIVDGAGAPLNVGRSERLFPPALRKALGVRDGGCAFPGCGRPVSWCDAHHIQPWNSAGTTCVDNGVLLCRSHHTAIHHGGWQVYLGPDRHPWFIPPHDPAEPQPAHLRSHARRTMTDLPTAA
ncbi:HNH endonuclease signature motif containing protein [Mycolicibacterium diernhoferi]|nr:HNH endonuclease signature motif containing protein [Mycolicibacterium diernhoferi]QYL22109.1 HNH endonuclease [Mycolicibacterium diernhoferi]